MTPADAAIWQQQILREVSDPNNTMTAVVFALWNAFATKGFVDPQLQVLYTKRGALDARLAEEYDAFDFQSDQDRFARSQGFTHLKEMRQSCEEEIVRVEKLARSRRVPATGVLITTAPITPPFPDSADANDAVYRGSPYERGRLGIP